MPELDATGRDVFLQRIADGLPFDQAEKLDILHELAAHLADSTARLEADGLPLDAAERTALDRLGPPERLAVELTRARRTPRRLLAAAGAGTWAAVSGVIYGYLFGVLILVVVSIGTAALAASAVHMFGGSWGGLLDNTAITLLALGVGAYAAGLKVTSVVAARAGYYVRAVRRVTTALGGALIAAYALVVWSGTLHWPAVAILLSLPVCFGAGAWRSTAAAFASRRWHLQVFGLMLVIVPLGLVLRAGQQPQSSGSGGLLPEGLERIGLATPASVAAAQDGDGGGIGRGIVSIGTIIHDPAVLAGWRDLRVEAWRGTGWDAVDPSLMAVDPAARGPFAVGPAGFEAPGQTLRWAWGASGTAVPDGSVGLSGSVRVDRSPNVTLAWVAITGLGPDGRRYIINGPLFDSTSFNGTAWDWFAAIVEGR